MNNKTGLHTSRLQGDDQNTATPTTTKVRSTCTRRNFLKTAGVAAGALGLAGATNMTAADGWLAPTSAHAEPEERVAHTFHQQLCNGNCSLKCTVRDGRLCGIQPNDAAADARYQTCCLKGISEIQHIYGDTRIQTPLKRVGERGSNEFVAISWDEAMDEVATQIKKIWDTYGKESVYVSASSEPRFSLLAPMLSAATWVEPGIDIGVANGMDPSVGGGGFASATSESRDWVNSKTLIFAGCNYLESSLMQIKSFFEAKEAGCKIVTVDPHFSTTASKSDQWIPIKPGTDAALFLAMISQVIDNEWYDAEFMSANTSMPFLVSVEDGSLLRDHAQDPDAEEEETGEENPFKVWDSVSQTAVDYAASGVTPALEGVFEIDGKQYTTVFSCLVENQKEYTVSWAAEKTGIDEQIIEDLAKQYATAGPASIALGWGGSDKFSNADVVGHAVAVLTALTGNIGVPGGSMGIFIGGRGYSATLGSWKFPDDMKSVTLDMKAYDFRTKQNDVHAVISVGNTFQQYFANKHLTDEWLQTLDFILGIDIYHNDSISFADIVLPACTKFEAVEEVGDIRVAGNHVQIQQKILDPLFESKTDFQIQCEIAKCLGLDEYMPATAEEFVRYQLENSKATNLGDITLERLQENQGVMPLQEIEEPRVGFADQEYKTTSTKMELYYEDLYADGQALPTWEENNEIYDNNPKMSEYPLQFAQVRTRFHLHSMFNDATWIQQFYEPYVEMNPTDMEPRGVETGDVIEAFNDRGSFKCKVHGNTAIRPGSVRMVEGTWSRYMVEGNLQNVTNDTMLERGYNLNRGPVTPFCDTLIEVKKA